VWEPIRLQSFRGSGDCVQSLLRQLLLRWRRLVRACRGRAAGRSAGAGAVALSPELCRLVGEITHLIGLKQDVPRHPRYVPSDSAPAYRSLVAAPVDSGIRVLAIQHSYRNAGGEGRGEVHLAVDRVQIDLHDDGLPFDLSMLPAQGPERLSERGHGVGIVRQLMNEVACAHGDCAGNHWLVKNVPREIAGDGR
jgi:hypothetical protein